MKDLYNLYLKKLLYLNINFSIFLIEIFIMRSNLCIQYYSYFQQLALSTFVFIICSLNVSAQSYEPIGTINPNNYEPAQKNIAQGKNGMVTTQHFLATAVGEKILNRGGNAYDAAIAVGFTLAVVLPIGS